MNWTFFEGKILFLWLLFDKGAESDLRLTKCFFNVLVVYCFDGYIDELADMSSNHMIIQFVCALITG